jgi:hypothetical protein
MSTFNTLVAKYLIENSEFELSNLTELETEFVDVLAQTFTDLYDKNKDRIFKTVQAKRKAIELKDLERNTPIVIIDFRREFDKVLEKQVKDLIQKTTNLSWVNGTNAELNTYLYNTFISFIKTVYFYLDPESPEDLCISIVNTKYLSEVGAQYGARIPDDMLSRRISIYYPAYVESTIKKAFADCFLYNMRSTMKFVTPGTTVPYFKERAKLLLKSIASKHGGLEDLLDY